MAQLQNCRYIINVYIYRRVNIDISNIPRPLLFPVKTFSSRTASLRFDRVNLFGFSTIYLRGLDSTADVEINSSQVSSRLSRPGVFTEKEPVFTNRNSDLENDRASAVVINSLVFVNTTIGNVTFSFIKVDILAKKT